MYNVDTLTSRREFALPLDIKTLSMSDNFTVNLRLQITREKSEDYDTLVK